MRFRASRCASLVGVLLLLLSLSSPILAAGPPGLLTDTRHTWQSEQGTFRSTAPGRWVEQALTGQVVYRENNRQRDYIELFDASRKRYVRLYPAGMYVFVPEKEHFRWVCAGKWDEGKANPLDLTRNAADRYHLETAEQRRSFPRLGKHFEVIAPATVSYNCIAWSVGNRDAWVWPKPAGEPTTLADFDALYTHYGYKRIAGLDVSRQPGLEKVVLFAVSRETGSIEITHASRQQTDGSWSSKLGSLPLIRHLKLDDVAGPTYGSPYVVYVRAKAR